MPCHIGLLQKRRDIVLGLTVVSTRVKIQCCIEYGTFLQGIDDTRDDNGIKAVGAGDVIDRKHRRTTAHSAAVDGIFVAGIDVRARAVATILCKPLHMAAARIDKRGHIIGALINVALPICSSQDALADGAVARVDA